MKFLLTLMLVSCSTIAFAQNSAEPSLFPELDVLKTNTNDKVELNKTEATISTDNLKEADTNVNEQVIDETNISQNVEKITQPAETPQKPTSPSKEEGKEEEEEQNILVFLDDIDVTLTPNRSGSFCTAKFGILNNTKKQLKEFSGTLVINQIKKNFDFSNTKSKNGRGESYLFIGRECEQLMDPPELEITKCKIEGWSEKKCKESIAFFATSNQENNIQ